VTVSCIPDSQTDHLAGLLFLFSICMLCISDRCLGDTAICIKIPVWTAQQPGEEQQFLISYTMKLKFQGRAFGDNLPNKLIYFCLKPRMQVMHTWQLIPMTGFVALCTAVFLFETRHHISPHLQSVLEILLTCHLLTRHTEATHRN